MLDICGVKARYKAIQGGKHSVSFSVRAGEILGISGLVGSGRTETVRAIFGADKIASGQLYLHGRPIQIGSPKDAVRYGLSLLTEDRKSQGVILNMNIAVNITLADLAKVSKKGLLFLMRDKPADLIKPVVKIAAE